MTCCDNTNNGRSSVNRSMVFVGNSSEVRFTSVGVRLAVRGCQFDVHDGACKGQSIEEPQWKMSNGVPRRPSKDEDKHDWTDHHDFANSLSEAEKAAVSVEQKMQKEEDPLVVYRRF